MTQEEIELLFQDLCARLPYGVKVTFAGYSGRDDCTLNSQHLNSTYSIEYLGLKPYLRPISSMTEEEKKEYQSLCVIYGDHDADDNVTYYYFDTVESFDWLNKNMFDYRDLIPKDLAIEVTKENNPYKN